MLTAVVVAALAVAGCASGARHASSATTVALGPTGAVGSSCVDALHRATAATLGASGLTMTQAAWLEHPAGATVSGGGAQVVTYQAPDRYHVVPTASSGSSKVVEQVFVGDRAWQGSDHAGWVRYTTTRQTDPLRWLRVPARASEATWSGGWCGFTASVVEGAVRGRAQIDAEGHLASLAMTLTTRGHTIQMAYRISRVGSSPPVGTPRT